MEKVRVTIADVAERAQVSKMSVSRVLSGQAGVSHRTRQRTLTPRSTPYGGNLRENLQSKA
jgi:hypothetical protein